MKRFLLAAALSIAAGSTFAADVGVSISIGEPGFYGRLDIGGFPAPRLIYREPKVVRRVDAHRPPVYLRVPPGHSKNWGKYCGRYNACDERVLFVQDNWYHREYVPRHQQRSNPPPTMRAKERRDDRRSEQGKRNNKNKDKKNDKGRGH